MKNSFLSIKSYFIGLLLISSSIVFLLFFPSCNRNVLTSSDISNPVDCIRPELANIGDYSSGHTRPIIALPHAMMRIYPKKNDIRFPFKLDGLPLYSDDIEGKNAFSLIPHSSRLDSLIKPRYISYDNERIEPFRYNVDLDQKKIHVTYTPSFKSALYTFDYSVEESGTARFFQFYGKKGATFIVTTDHIEGHVPLKQGITLYLYMEANQPIDSVGFVNDTTARVDYVCLAKNDTISANQIMVGFPSEVPNVSLRYGISYISSAQAKENLHHEIQAFNTNVVAKMGKNEWQKAMARIEVEGGSAIDRLIFYTSLYRTYLTPINISEYGKYFSVADSSVHEDGGTPCYYSQQRTSDLPWSHMLRTLIDPQTERNIIVSLIRMAHQDKKYGRFPQNVGKNALPIISFAYSSGVTDFNMQSAYMAAIKTLTETSIVSGSYKSKNALNSFFEKNGYCPASFSSIPKDNLSPTADRASVYSTLLECGYYKALSNIASSSGHVEEAEKYAKMCTSYIQLFDYERMTFIPKDANGKFIGKKDLNELPDSVQQKRFWGPYLDRYTIKWFLPSSPEEISLYIGGKQKMVEQLDELFLHHYAHQSSTLATLQIPYLYNYTKSKYLAQKMLRRLLYGYFETGIINGHDFQKNEVTDFCASVVFAMLGLHPVSPISATYYIGVPCFDKIMIYDRPQHDYEIITSNRNSEVNNYFKSASIGDRSVIVPFVTQTDLSIKPKMEINLTTSISVAE